MSNIRVPSACMGTDPFFLCDAGDECLPQLYIDINKYAYIVYLSDMV
jgi:hypothetical protein